MSQRFVLQIIRTFLFISQRTTIIKKIMNIFLSMTENKTKRQLAKTGTRMLFLEYLSMFKEIDKTWKCIERRYESNLLEKGQYHQDTLFSYRDNCIDYSTISAIIH